MAKYVYKEYNSEYPNLFLTEKKKLAKKLGPFVRIEHIGSTAIPGLGGKGTIDIALGAQQADLTEVKNKLEEMKYEFKEDTSLPARFFFRIKYLDEDETRIVHLHLTKVRGKDWNEMIGFRDYLIKNPKFIEEYIKVKKSGVSQSKTDGEKYNKYKLKFIENITSDFEE